MYEFKSPASLICHITFLPHASYFYRLRNSYFTFGSNALIRNDEQDASLPPIDHMLCPVFDGITGLSPLHRAILTGIRLGIGFARFILNNDSARKLPFLYSRFTSTLKTLLCADELTTVMLSNVDAAENDGDRS